MRVLGLDVGEKRIGVARADSDTRISIPVGYVVVDGSEWQEIARIANLQGSSFFVIGMPRSNEGNETQQSLYVRNFAKMLTEKIPGARVRFQDESLTSVEAEGRLKARKKSYEKGEIDAEAAAIILQDFLESFKVPVAAQPADTSLIEKEVTKVKRKTKRVVGWVSGVAIVVVLALLIVGGVLLVNKIREDRARERAEEYARQEAAMVVEVFDFEIKPGETVFDVKKNLIEVGYTAAEVDEAFLYDYDFDFLIEPREKAAARGDKSNYLEGYLYGERHEFYKTATVKEILTQFLEGTKTIFEENKLAERYAERGLSLYEGVTLASIIQREAKASEMPTVAQVFLLRLAYGIPLGSDVTVSYALDVVDPERDSHSDNQAALSVNSCYNTRLYGGLPCGPISNPGLAALIAVAEPTDTAYLYFLTGDDGLMYYSYTEAEHIQNIYSHCQKLCNVAL